MIENRSKPENLTMEERKLYWQNMLFKMKNGEPLPTRGTVKRKPKPGVPSIGGAASEVLNKVAQKQNWGNYNPSILCPVVEDSEDFGKLYAVVNEITEVLTQAKIKKCNLQWILKSVIAVYNP